MAKKSSANKTKRAPLRPSRTTAVIVIIGACAATGVFVGLVRPASTDLAAAVDQRDEARQVRTENERTAADFEANRVYSGAELAGRVQPIEALLPSFDPAVGARPGEVVVDLEQQAKTRGLTAANVQYPNAFTPLEGNDKLLKADVTMTVTGERDQVFDYLRFLNNYPRLLGVATGGVQGAADGAYSTSLTVTIWVTTADSWLGGRPTS